ncbi:MAG: ATP-dependent nuclease [Stenotrophobium sp.]
MYLASLEVTDFRSLKKLEVRFRNGLNVLIGPNNAGKTAIADALRVLLSTGEEGALRMSDFDLRIDGGVAATQAEFKYIFHGLTPDEEADFLPALKPWINDGVPSYEAHISVRYAKVDDGGRLRVKRWCGAHEENAVTAEMLEDLRAIYLPPLRDPAQGLKPSRASQLSRLVQRLSNEASRKDVVDALAKFDVELKGKAPISDTEKAVNSRHKAMLGDILSQKLGIGLAPSDFQRLAARLALEVDSLEVEQNGLGFNNLIYMAVVLSELSMNNDAAYCALIVEEPEAHLHPQLQTILLEYLKAVEKPEPGEKAVQVFVTSHSPNFAALADIDSLGCFYRADAEVEAFFPREVTFEKAKKEKLQRYLNVTRADVFFARRIIFVEGAAELFIVDALARALSFDLRKHSVSLISVDGLNFDAFIPLFGEKALKVPVAIITDGDPPKAYPKVGESPDRSAAAKVIAASTNKYVSAFFAMKTLEYDLALIPKNRPTMLSALKDIHPGIGASLEADVEKASEDEKAKVLYQGMFERGSSGNVQKGAFGQALAYSISELKLPIEAPQYIKDALTAMTKV